VFSWVPYPISESAVILFKVVFAVGHVDPGESDMETAVRETEEEAGLRRSDYEVLDFQKVLTVGFNYYFITFPRS